jgi:hypothetical protein
MMLCAPIKKCSQPQLLWSTQLRTTCCVPLVTLPPPFVPPQLPNMDLANLFFSGELVHVVGINISDRGRNCTTHNLVPCGSSLLVNDWVTFNLVELKEIKEKAIEVRRIVQGEVACRVGFLQRTYVPHFQRYVGRFAQVRDP